MCAKARVSGSNKSRNRCGIRVGSDVAIGSITATVHIVPQQIRPKAPLGCEVFEGLDILIRVIPQTIASSTENEATAGNCRTPSVEVIVP